MRDRDTEDVTVALDPDTLAALDRKALRDHRGYRGAAVSALLEEWLAQRGDA
jgi:hypothetical protein